MAGSELEESISILLGRSGGWAGFRSYEFIGQIKKLGTQYYTCREAVTESYRLHETTSQSKKLESQSYEFLVARSNAIIEANQKSRTDNQQLRAYNHQLRTRNRQRIELAGIEPGDLTS